MEWYLLVGGWTTHLKNMLAHIGNLHQIAVKNKNTWNHHLVYSWCLNWCQQSPLNQTNSEMANKKSCAKYLKLLFYHMSPQKQTFILPFLKTIEIQYHEQKHQRNMLSPISFGLGEGQAPPKPRVSYPRQKHNHYSHQPLLDISNIKGWGLDRSRGGTAWWKHVNT